MTYFFLKKLVGISFLGVFFFFISFLYAQKAIAEDPCVLASAPTLFVGDIIVTEVLPNPVGEDLAGEFIELYNPTSKDLDLAGVKIVDATGKGLTFQDGRIESKKYYAVWREDSGISLNNSGEERVEIRYNDTVIDQVSFSEGNEEGKSYAFVENKWIWTNTVTPGEKNIESSSESEPDYSEEDEIEEPVDERIIVDYVVFTEVFPNPEGVDDGEFIEVYNYSAQDVDLGGLYIDDNEGGSSPYKIPEDTIIGGQSYYVFLKQDTRLSLNNDTDAARLLNSNKEELTGIEYEDAKEGMSFGFNEYLSTWEWTPTITPNEVNVFDVIEENANEDNIVSLTDIAELEDAESVIVTGTVFVEPGVYGTQYFYIGTRLTGVQVYMHSADFPELSIGDRVEVRGELSTIRGERRIKVKTADDIILVEQKDIDVPVISLDTVTTQMHGALLSTTGTVTDVKKGYYYIDNGTVEMKVELKSEAVADALSVEQGNIVTTTGIVIVKEENVSLWPRMIQDIQVWESEEATSTTSTIIFDEKETDSQTTTAATLGVGSLAFGFVAKKYGQVWIGLIKELVQKIGQ